MPQNRPFLGRSSLGLPQGREWPREPALDPVAARQRKRLPPPPFWLRDPELAREYASVMNECQRWGVEVVCEPEPPPGGFLFKEAWGGVAVVQGQPARIWFPPGCRYATGPALLLVLLARCVVGDGGVIAFTSEAARRRRIASWRRWASEHYYLPSGASWAKARGKARLGDVAVSRLVCISAGVFTRKARPTYKRPGPPAP